MHLKRTVKISVNSILFKFFKLPNAICSICILSLLFFNNYAKQFKNSNTALLSTLTCKLKCTVISNVNFLFFPTQYPTHCIFLWQKYSEDIKPLVNCIVLKQCAMLKHILAKEEKKRLYSALYPWL